MKVNNRTIIMKKITLLLALIMCVNMAFSNPIDTTTAKIVAANFWRQNNVVGIKNGKTIRIQREVPDFRVKQMDSIFHNFYILTAVDTVGFVIVSADDQATPILGYSMENSFEVQNMPPNLKDWLMGYEQAIQAADAYRCSDEIRNEWGRLLAGEALPTRSITSVSPLLTTNWDQGFPYNLSCPYDYDENDYTVTGCVATAMAQVMKYWEHPQIGTGSHTYTHPIYGTLSANFESAFAWNEMLNNYSAASSYTMMQASAISTLMYMCGVSVDMNYGVESQNGSSAITTAAALLGTNPLSQTYPSAENALRTFFDYSSNLTGVAKSDYSNSQWISILKNELDSGRVILYSGSGSGGGHAFVCDGYSNNNTFHFNWGWSGYCNGYFSLSSLTPGSGGTGSGSGDYSYSQQAVVGITPENQSTHPNYDLVMYGSLTTSDTSYLFGPNHNVVINCAIANAGSATFNGYLTAMVADLEGHVVAEVSTYASISANHYVNKSFTVQGGLPLGPGRYFVVITSATNLNDPTTSRIIRDNLSNINFAQFKVTYEADIETFSEFDLSEYMIYTGQSLTVNVDVANFGYDFSGDLSVALLSMTGSYVQTIQQHTLTSPLESMTHYTNGIDFTGTITAPVGDYFLTLRYRPQGSSNWYYAGSYFYQNPVRITVHAQPVADMYEANNTAASAYTLSPVFADDVAEVNTNGANFHSATDVDYYKIVLPSGYSYQVVPVLQDYYYNDDIAYSVDAKFYASLDNGASWSNEFDLDANILQAPVANFNDGGVVYIKVMPTFVGDIGTYSLHVQVLRQINPDQYEENNTSATAYNLGTVNSSNVNYNVNANFHITTDADYYKINLPSGYSYTINANILNSYNNTSYTADAKFATSQDGNTWSSNYGNAMSAMTMSDGGTLYFRVLPYTDHEIGTYQLQVSITRTGGIEPDQYEPNNTSATAYNLGTVNSSNANYNVNANFHVTTDNDYYKINLPSGYFYTINANILNSGNNSSYTANAHFANSQTGNAWSSNYNNSMPELTISDGGTLYFRVLPVTSSEIGTYSLHISVTRTAMIEPDIYEPNNTVNTSYLLATINEPTSSIVANASFHTTSDEDYYKIDFPADYNYSVEVVMFDCTNDPNCSVDAKIAVSDDGNNWSSFYGISIPAMTIEHGGRFYYHVVPQQTASTGTYQLYFSISRTTGIQDNELSSIMLYPNPVTDHLIINGANEIQLDGIEIYDITGRLIQTIEKDCRMINTTQLSKGKYLLRLFTSEGEVVKKFLK